MKPCARVRIKARSKKELFASLNTTRKVKIMLQGLGKAGIQKLGLGSKFHLPGKAQALKRYNDFL